MVEIKFLNLNLNLNNKTCPSEFFSTRYKNANSAPTTAFSQYIQGLAGARVLVGTPVSLY